MQEWHWLFYDASAGEGKDYILQGDFDLHRFARYTDWRTSWQQLIPGRFFGTGGRQDVMFYDGSAGEGELYTRGRSGRLIRQNRFTGWRNSWSHIVPGRFFDDTELDGLLFYDPSAGEGELYAADGSGGLTRRARFTGWRNSWSHVVSADFRSPSSDLSGLLLYDGAAGEAEFLVADGSGGLTRNNQFTGWRRSWSQIVSFDVSRTLLLYDSTAGGGELLKIYWVDGRWTPISYRQYPGWGHTWSQIVPLSFILPDPERPEEPDEPEEPSVRPAQISLAYRMGPFGGGSHGGSTGSVRFLGDLLAPSGETSSPEGTDAFTQRVDWVGHAGEEYYFARGVVGGLTLGNWRISVESPVGVLRSSCEVNLNQHGANPAVNFQENVSGCARGFQFP